MIRSPASIILPETQKQDKESGTSWGTFWSFKITRFSPCPCPARQGFPALRLFHLAKNWIRLFKKNSSHYSKIHPPASSDHIDMKLDTHAIRYLTGEDWRVLTAVRLPSSSSPPSTCPRSKSSNLRSGRNGQQESRSRPYTIDHANIWPER